MPDPGVDLNESLPPGPFSIEENRPAGAPPGGGFVWVVDANGRKIVNLYGRRAERLALAALILDARNRT